jgi:mandelate racemase
MPVNTEAAAEAGLPGLRVRSAGVRAVRVPLRFTLGTSADEVRAVPLVLLDLHTSGGVTGRAYAFGYTAAGARAIAALAGEAAGLVGNEPVAPGPILRRLSRRYTLLGVTGAVRIALSTLDMALWDALSQALGQPLATVLRAHPRPVPAYDSRGLGLMDPARLADEAAMLLGSSGLGAVKVRLGHPTLDADLAAVEAVRAAIPASAGIMVDYNQALDPAEAMRRGLALDGRGLVWLEEPVRHDDYAACRALAAALHLPVQIGENFNGPAAMSEALAAGACDLAMPDVTRIGGVTGWMQAAALAEARSVPLSSHLMPEVCASLLAASATAHWLEYVDWADAILAEPFRPQGGALAAPSCPGSGILWDEDRIARLEGL